MVDHHIHYLKGKMSLEEFKALSSEEQFYYINKMFQYLLNTNGLLNLVKGTKFTEDILYRFVNTRGSLKDGNPKEFASSFGDEFSSFIHGHHTYTETQVATKDPRALSLNHGVGSSTPVGFIPVVIEP